jgi:lipoprotein NlpI
MGKSAEKLTQKLDHFCRVTSTAWPAPVIRLFLGELSPVQTIVAAYDKDPQTKHGKVCEANFYSGELALQRSDKRDALRFFRLAVNACPKDFIEWEGADAELKALGAAP